jgi:hypothetical protein
MLTTNNTKITLQKMRKDNAFAILPFAKQEELFNFAQLVSDSAFNFNSDAELSMALTVNHKDFIFKSKLSENIKATEILSKSEVIADMVMQLK